ncbi:hypothetical protein IC229_19110 [Spirosoma sp. BT702]|uniref:Uncharacterized protein n=1 Tax=Spirosoma profusum TaxID=2771354 RepID=A0A927AT71_9BACT|nr:hypothetical protein [Spirosoma profusum]MBD2702765.1 hypothetical protein [Spirosoma profusum]
MEKVSKSIPEIEMQALREGIKSKYSLYQQIDRDHFPDFEYNTNRANYKPLRDSFVKELFGVQGLDATSSAIHIPSTNTLALLFTDEHYVPGKKLLDTCKLYATERSISEENHTPISVTDQVETKPVSISPKLMAGGFAVLTGMIVLLYIARQFTTPVPSNLVIIRPLPQSPVPVELVVKGTVSNAELVWLAVRYEKGKDYWIQPPIKVQHDGNWVGVAYAGSESSDHAGLTYQIRAFVNPVHELKSGQIYYAWPEAELTSSIVEVVRK